MASQTRHFKFEAAILDPEPAVIQTRGLVSKETVVLRRWGGNTKFWIYQLS